MKRLIVTADDFGISPGVNAAIEDSHRHGILSAASLMVAGDAAADAVARARRLPSLGVGLHLVLVDGAPILPPARLPDLVDATGRFPNAPARLGARLYFSAAARRQAEAETRAQLDAFRATGLPLDHVNAHHHFHFHPAVRDLLIRLAPEYGIRAIRVPREPGNMLLRPFAASLRRRFDRAGIVHNDWQLGLSDTGAMTTARTKELLGLLPNGVTEIYFHPAPGNDDHQALVDPEIVAMLKARHLHPTVFAQLWCNGTMDTGVRR
ncbi:MAG TPA: hopanoid biosynthesis-associated protein HpnK [Stellaceae bacterium]